MLEDTFRHDELLDGMWDILEDLQYIETEDVLVREKLDSIIDNLCDLIIEGETKC